MNKLTMKSRDVIGGNVEKIAELFPHCVTERRNKAGQLERAIDWTKLQAELAPDLILEGEERYQFTWPDKRAAARLANEPTTLTLRPCREESVDFDATENLYIEGDNLDVLKVLRETYLGKVKMIYIDPPYNTGNDFVYHDDFDVAREVEEFRNDLFDEDGMQTLSRFERNTAANGRFHTDWLNMMYPRLKVARDLLTEDGMIFISIDNQEYENLTKISNEIFGEINHVTTLIWEKRYTRSNNSRTFTTLTEFILVYRKDLSLTDIREPRNEKADSTYSNPDNDPRGVWTSVSCVNPATKEQRPNLSYAIFNPVTGEEVVHPTNAWKFSKEMYSKYVEENRFYWGKEGKNTYPRLKKFLSEMEDSMVPVDLWKQEDTGTTDQASKELESLFKGKFFDFPKPTSLIKRILSLRFGGSEEIIILDFFSGSATTAHAVMQLNAEDDGGRKFIMVQLPEATDEKSEARKAGYQNICEIGKERIRRAGKKIKEVAGEAAQGLDTGFRVLKLDSSNMAEVFYTPEKVEEGLLDSLVDNIKPDRTGEDLLFQVMLELGIALSAKIARREIAGKTVYAVDEDYLLACFDADVNETTIEEMAKRQPTHLVIRDASAASDSVLDNFSQIIASYSNEKPITTHIL